MRTFRFISPEGKIVKTHSLVQFAKDTGIPYNFVKQIACKKINLYSAYGWWSTKPKALKAYKQRVRVLVNTETDEVLRMTNKEQFAKDNELCPQLLTALTTGKKMLYKGWVTEDTYNAIKTCAGQTSV